MPLYDFKCDNCGHKEEDVFRHSSQLDDPEICKSCNTIMRRLFPKGTHSVIDGKMDHTSIGKKIKEKNEQVKAKFAGYSYEQASIKEKVTKMVNDKIGNI
jgi:putative FmdB family regulatory protein